MAGKEEKKKPKNLDDFLASLEKEHSTSLDSAFKAHDEFSKEENINHLYLNVFVPGQEALYGTLVKELDKIFDKKDETKVEKEADREKVKKAVTKALKSYFEKTHPTITKSMADLKMNDTEQYDFLTQMYDDHVGVGRIKGVESLKAGIEGLLGKKKSIGHIKKQVYDSRMEHLKGALSLTSSKYVTHHFGRYHPTQIAAYLKPKLEKEGFEVKDKVGYATADLSDLIGLRRGVIEKEGHPYLTKKKEKK